MHVIIHLVKNNEPAEKTRLPDRIGSMIFWKRGKKWIVGIALLIPAALALNIVIYLVWPDVSRLQKERPGKTSFMEYRERQWKREGIEKKDQPAMGAA